ncbi:MAG: hypothetical protein L0Y76_12885 [Ignavibacteria bacterium]|nr:hypothetical protein [Ignavibacteria bacterium]
MKKLILFIFLLSFVSGTAYTQEDAEKKSRKRSRQASLYLGLGDVEKPTIELSYGPSKIQLDGYTGEFDNTSLMDFRIGFSTARKFKNNKVLNEFDFYYLSLGTYSTNLDFRENSDNPYAKRSKNWRFGFGGKGGYTIMAGTVGILPYTSTSAMWTKTDWESDSTYSDPVVDNRLEAYGDVFRFGNTYESGLSFQIEKSFSIDLAYERNNTYQRTMFWKQSGSIILQEIGVGLIDIFVKEVLDRKPVAGSILNFILKSAYYYGFYQLKSNEMNWPFGGESTINYNTFKFGVGFEF